LLKNLKGFIHESYYFHLQDAKTRKQRLSYWIHYSHCVFLSNSKMHATFKNNLYQSFITWITYLCHNIETSIYAHDEKNKWHWNTKTYLGGNPQGKSQKTHPKLTKEKVNKSKLGDRLVKATWPSNKRKAKNKTNKTTMKQIKGQKAQSM
jgi:hypothetical protein